MLVSAFYNGGLSALVSGWSSPTIRTIYILEIAMCIVSIAVGLFVPYRRLKNIIISGVGIVGLMLILYTICIGLRSDAEILIPFIGEILLLSAVVALVISLLKRKTTCD